MEQEIRWPKEDSLSADGLHSWMSVHAVLTWRVHYPPCKHSVLPAGFKIRFSTSHLCSSLSAVVRVH